MGAVKKRKLVEETRDELRRGSLRTNMRRRNMERVGRYGERVRMGESEPSSLSKSSGWWDSNERKDLASDCKRE